MTRNLTQMTSARRPGLRVSVHRVHDRGPVDGAIEAREQPRVMIGRTPDHHAVHKPKLFVDRRGRCEPAVQDEFQVRKVVLQAPYFLVAQARYLAVLLGGKTLEDRIARMHDEGL